MQKFQEGDLVEVLKEIWRVDGRSRSKVGEIAKIIHVFECESGNQIVAIDPMNGRPVMNDIVLVGPEPPVFRRVGSV